MCKRWQNWESASATMDDTRLLAQEEAASFTWTWKSPRTNSLGYSKAQPDMTWTSDLNTHPLNKYMFAWRFFKMICSCAHIIIGLCYFKQKQIRLPLSLAKSIFSPSPWFRVLYHLPAPHNWEGNICSHLSKLHLRGQAKYQVYDGGDGT